jgi:hypothetical protein
LSFDNVFLKDFLFDKHKKSSPATKWCFYETWPEVENSTKEIERSPEVTNGIKENRKMVHPLIVSSDSLLFGRYKTHSQLVKILSFLFKFTN